MTTNTNTDVVEMRLSVVDQEELAYNVIGYELEVSAQDADRIELTGEHDEMRRWVAERWAPVAKAKGWPPARALVVKGEPVEY